MSLSYWSGYCCYSVIELQILYVTVLMSQLLRSAFWGQQERKLVVRMRKLNGLFCKILQHVPLK